MAGISKTFDARAFHDIEEEEIDHDELERQEELRQLLSEDLGELSDNELESQPYYGEDQWPYSAYPLDVYQQQQGIVWNGSISDEDQPWPASRILPWSGGAQVYDCGGNPASRPLASHPLLVTSVGDVYVGDNVSQQRAAKQSQATSDKLQEDFLNPEGVSAIEQRWTQLEILYKRRGQEIEELRLELRELHDLKDRDERVLNHHIALLQVEKDGLTESERQCRAALSQAQANGQELTSKVAALQKTIDTLTAANDELTKRLHTLEASEESLHAQLQAVAQSDALVRASQQHEAIVTSITHKMEGELHSLRDKLDAMERERDDLESEVTTLRAQLSKLQRLQDAAIVDHSTTVLQPARNLGTYVSSFLPGLTKKSDSRTFADQMMQTDVDNTLHNHYKAALSNIRSHVVKHLEASQSCKLKVLQDEMSRDRLMFARNL